MRTGICWGLALLAVVMALRAHAYPSTERATLDLGLAAPTAFRIDDDHERLYHAVGETLRAVDLATFALDSTTPFNIAGDTTLTGAIQGMAFDFARNALYATQSGGFLLTYTLNNLAAKPLRTALSATGTVDVTHLEVDPSTGRLFGLSPSTSTILRLDPVSKELVAIPLVNTAGAPVGGIEQIRFVPGVSGSTGMLFVSTNVGQLFAVNSATAAASRIVLDPLLADDLKGMAALPNSSRVYVVNASKKQLHKIATASLTDTGTLAIPNNNDLNQIVVTSVTNPSATYGFVLGSSGMTVFNTGNDEIFDLGTTSTANEPLKTSGSGPIVTSDDGYLFYAFGKVGVISDNPFVTIRQISYSGGGSTMKAGESVTITFQSDETGTYTLRAGGDIAGSGSVLKTASGDATGSVTATATDHAVTIPYNDNTARLSEGKNRVFVFVKDGQNNLGRRASTITVDTPPPNVTITGIGFGNEKLYVNIARVNVSDIATYRVYVTTDAATATTTTTVGGTASQPASGDASVKITGLNNGTTYFVAAEAVDTGGNVSATRTTTLVGGAVASAAPEGTFGPAGVSGERGCTLIPRP